MGCCVSANKDSEFDKVESKSTHESRAPPPSLDQEETVKEVLSETPKPKTPPPPPPPPPLLEPFKNREHHHQEKHHTSKNVHFQPPPLLDEKIRIRESSYENEKMSQVEEISEIEASEVCSLSLGESLLAATINNNGRVGYDDCDDEEVKQRAVMKSPAPKLAPRNRVSGELGSKSDRPPPPVGKSPTRRTDRSPSRRNNAVRSAVQSGRDQTGRLRSRSDPHRRDPGESSGRRPRSPAANRSTTGRIPSAGKANQSPGRVRTDPPERGGSGMKMGYSTGPTNESLENPLVSLECFIFL